MTAPTKQPEYSEELLGLARALVAAIVFAPPTDIQCNVSVNASETRKDFAALLLPTWLDAYPEPVGDCAETEVPALVRLRTEIDALRKVVEVGRVLASDVRMLIVWADREYRGGVRTTAVGSIRSCVGPLSDVDKALSTLDTKEADIGDVRADDSEDGILGRALEDDDDHGPVNLNDEEVDPLPPSRCSMCGRLPLGRGVAGHFKEADDEKG